MSKINKDCAYFFAQASHDLRQPLQALILYLDLFDTSELSPKQKILWQKILKTTDNLKNLFTNILDFSKTELGSIKVHKTNMNIGILLNDLVQEYRTLSKTKKIIFEYNICDCKIYTDYILLERILRNLLNNAFKFTKSRINLTCKETNKYIYISISDDGMGIDSSDLPNIFNEFYQGHNTYKLNNDGAGLGLTIVKKFTDILNIKISISSTINIGSCFTLKLKK